jgi:acyl-CoA thioesterase FadM
MHDLGGDLYVVKSTLEYKASAVYDDWLHIGMRCQRIGNTHLTFDHFLPNDGRLGTTSISGPDNGSGEGGGTRDADDQGLTLQR